MSSRAQIAWLVLIAIILAVIFIRNARNEPLMRIAATPAASTHCVKPELACGAHCTRLIAKRSLT